MTELTEDEAEEHWVWAQGLDECEASDAWDDFRIEQPALFQWLLERCEKRFEPEVGELLTQVTATIWSTMRHAARELDEGIQSVRPGDIQEMEIQNATMLQVLSDRGALEMSMQERFAAVCEHLENISQEYVLTLAFEALEDAHLDRSPELDDFNFALALHYLKVILDCLDEA